MPKKNGTTEDPVVAELQNIKRLLVFSLLKSGASQDEVGVALGITQGTVSKMFPGGVSTGAARAGNKGKKSKG